MKNILENKGSILKKDNSKEKGELFNDVKKYITAALVGMGLFTANPIKAEGYNNTSNFNYREPVRDVNGVLLARTDLKHESEIPNGYSSVKELFTKLNSMTKTQIEPLFRPQYVGEINEKTGEKIPTFIIVGDFHTDEFGKEYNKKRMLDLKLEKGHLYLVEENENAKQEIDVIEILNKKFGINVIGLENEGYGYKNGTKIGKGVEKINIKTIGLEEVEINYEKFMKHIDILRLAIIEYLFRNMNENSSYEKTLKYDGDSEKKFLNYNINKLIFSRNKNILLYKYRKKNIDDYISIAQLYYDHFSNFGEEDILIAKKQNKYLYNIYKKEVEALIEDLNKKFNKNQLKEKINEICLHIAENHSKILDDSIDRNSRGINIMDKELKAKNENIGVMVYGKAHIRDLIEQLNQKYGGKVNIYIAK